MLSGFFKSLMLSAKTLLIFMALVFLAGQQLANATDEPVDDGTGDDGDISIEGTLPIILGDE